MNTSISSTSTSQPDPGLRKGITRRAIQLAVSILLQAAILLLVSGRLDWGMAWAYLGVYAAGIAFNAIVLLRRNPALIAKRAETSPDTKRWDLWLGIIFTVFGYFGVLLVAALDMRNGWSGGFTQAGQLVALAVVAAGNALSSWAMLSNRFFASTVHIQRGQFAVSDGPYRFVRHPAYTGIIVMTLCMGPMLGSWWALAPGVLAVLTLLLRTALEDRTLLNELPGYLAYTRQTHWRLIPGIW